MCNLQCVLRFGGFSQGVDFVARTLLFECVGDRLCNHEKTYLSRPSQFIAVCL